MADRYNGESGECELYIVMRECMLKKAVREDTISTLIQRYRELSLVG